MRWRTVVQKMQSAPLPRITTPPFPLLYGETEKENMHHSFPQDFTYGLNVPRIPREATNALNQSVL